MSLNLAVIGQTGQLARALVGAVAERGHTAHFHSRQDCDLIATSEDINAFLEGLPSIDAIIIAAAYTAVDKAEEERDLAYKANANAPGIIATFCAERDISLVHVSTDYVFDGKGTAPYRPEHPTRPINHYGATKLAGEQAITESGCRAAILRTSWVFDGTGNNFVTTMLRLGKNRTELSVVGDQIGRPTYAGHLAKACVFATESLCADQAGASGIYHVSGSGGAISWADFADAIFRRAAKHLPHDVTVNAITTSEFPTPAVRPAYSVMDISSFENQFNYKLPKWSEGLDEALAAWAHNQ